MNRKGVVGNNGAMDSLLPLKAKPSHREAMEGKPMLALMCSNTLRYFSTASAVTRKMATLVPTKMNRTISTKCA